MIFMNENFLIFSVFLCVTVLLNNNAIATKNSMKCLPKQYLSSSPNNIVCVCNSTYCDEIEQIGQLNSNQVAIYLSTKSGKRLEKQLIQFENLTTTTTTSANEKPYIEIGLNPNEKFQTILGFGGAFTDAVGFNLKNLSLKTQKNFIDSYFSNKGIEYTLGRVPIASCDFSTHVYSYCDTDGDFELKTFNLTIEDYELKIPYIKEAQKLAPNLKLFASPWSPPGWMKTTGRMVGGGLIKGQFNGKYYQTWSNYFLKFFEAYHQQNIDFWGLTLQNEPSVGLVKSFKWQALYLSAAMQTNFVAELLGPALKNSTITKNLKIMLNDDNRYVLPFHADVFYSNKTTASYIDGIGVHWYANAIFSATRLSTVHEQYPNKFILATEACNGYVPFFNGPILGDWARGEYYATDIIENLENWSIGWTDWNLCLDAKGGPNHAKNFVDSPIIINSTADEFYKQPMYYFMGHFSKFIRPGSIRIAHKISTNMENFEVKYVEIIAHEFNNNQTILVVQNRLEKEINLRIKKNSLEKFSMNLEAKSIGTFIWNN